MVHLPSQANVRHLPKYRFRNSRPMQAFPTVDRIPAIEYTNHLHGRSLEILCKPVNLIGSISWASGIWTTFLLSVGNVYARKAHLYSGPLDDSRDLWSLYYILLSCISIIDKEKAQIGVCAPVPRDRHHSKGFSLDNSSSHCGPHYAGENG